MVGAISVTLGHFVCLRYDFQRVETQKLGCDFRLHLQYEVKILVQYEDFYVEYGFCIITRFIHLDMGLVVIFYF